MSGGIAPYTWSLTGLLPNGLSMNAGGVISGTITAPGGTFTPTIRVTDSVGGTSAVAVTWKVLAITNPTNATRVTAKNQVIANIASAVTGGTGPYTWAVSGKPTGIAINAGTGVISGTPTGAKADYPTTVTVTDAGTGLSESVTFTWTVN